jgi:hypothetical protein
MHERGTVVLGWLTKVVVALAIVGIAGFDTIAIIASHVSLTDDANAAAEAANTSWNDDHNVQLAYNAAVTSAEQHGAQVPVKDFSIARNGTVHLTLTHTVTTLVVRHIGPLKKQADVTAKGEATTPVG